VEATVTESSDRQLLARLESLALEAGRQILRCRDEGFSVDVKADASPVTAADRSAEAIILRGLRDAYPATPIVAEEEVSAGRCPAALGYAFFLVDPLDGTREFVNGRDDFTVNIALIRDGEPVVGVVYAPAKANLCGGRPGHAETVSVAPDHTPLRRQAVRVAGGERTRIVASRSHRTAETDAFIACFPGAECVAIGSSLKFCLLASGAADIYPRFGRTMEWDTAAGDAVLRAAGGRTLTPDGRPLLYGKRNQASDSDFANPFFIAYGELRQEWSEMAGFHAATAD
jgi:3'(2'), 5'-bisphosphate nucleotidase